MVCLDYRSNGFQSDPKFFYKWVVSASTMQGIVPNVLKLSEVTFFIEVYLINSRMMIILNNRRKALHKSGLFENRTLCRN